MQKAFDMTGWAVGKLKVLGRSGKLPCGRVVWACVCECGNLTGAQTNQLRKWEKQSCGCTPPDRKARPIRGLGRHPLYRAWLHMMYRCFWPAKAAYKDYGARGITVCEEWRDFRNFIAWAGERPPGTTLDRIDNDGPYAPHNCRWATPFTQASNTRRSVKITWQGRTQVAAAWARETGISRQVIYYRVRKGLPPEEVLRAA